MKAQNRGEASIMATDSVMKSGLATTTANNSIEKYGDYGEALSATAIPKEVTEINYQMAM